MNNIPFLDCPVAIFFQRILCFYDTKSFLGGVFLAVLVWPSFGYWYPDSPWGPAQLPFSFEVVLVLPTSSGVSLTTQLQSDRAWDGDLAHTRPLRHSPGASAGTIG